MFNLDKFIRWVVEEKIVPYHKLLLWISLTFISLTIYFNPIFENILYKLIHTVLFSSSLGIFLVTAAIFFGGDNDDNGDCDDGGRPPLPDEPIPDGYIDNLTAGTGVGRSETKEKVNI